MRLVDWYLGLGWKEKIVVAVAAGAGVFLASFVIAMAVLSFLLGPQDEQSAQQPQATAPPDATRREGATTTSDPDINLEVTDARWEEEKAVVEGRWWADTDISSVHCDLFEGDEDAQRTTRWWDRSVAASMNWSERTFSQDFVAAQRRETKGTLPAAGEYSVTCSANFSGGWSVSASAPVEGNPPG